MFGQKGDEGARGFPGPPGPIGLQVSTHIHLELTFDVPSLPQNIYINIKVCIYALLFSSSIH